MAAFGCATNQFSSAGDPLRATPAGGPMIPSASSTPGSSGPAIPVTMISSAVDRSVDAIAVLEGNRGFEGRVLGPAAPAEQTTVTRQVTGQFIPPSAYGNRQMTINSSIGSPSSVAAIVSGAAGDSGVGAAPGVFFGNAAVLPQAGNVATSTGLNTSVGVTGLSNTTATGVAGGTSLMLGTRVTAAPATISSVQATPIIGTAGRLNVDTVVARTATTPVRVETTSGRVTVTNASSTNP
ncbi:MAG TPA: hypothetical protein VM779_12265 [Thermoanaerobaculia bacterium]|nr:hypothetical protein [Thermoanaerobaculia bacterium]